MRYPTPGYTGDPSYAGSGICRAANNIPPTTSVRATLSPRCLKLSARVAVLKPAFLLKTYIVSRWPKALRVYTNHFVIAHFLNNENGGCDISQPPFFYERRLG